MTAMDATLSAGLPDERVIAVMMLSGAPIVVDQWAPKLKARAGKLKVLVTHGRADPVLPFVGSGWLKDLLESSLGKAAVTYETHGGGHDLRAVGAAPWQEEPAYMLRCLLIELRSTCG